MKKLLYLLLCGAMLVGFTACDKDELVTITLLVNDETMGTVSGAGTYAIDKMVTLRAIPNEGYLFVSWSDGNTTNPCVVFVTEDISLTAIFAKDPLNGHEGVDLGLPSGTIWAACNVGATAPQKYGDYFAWGETQAKSRYDWTEAGDYQWGVYDWTDKTNRGMTKYNNTDGKEVLDAEDDVATVLWGAPWRMPNTWDVHELNTECTWTWTMFKGVYGYMVTGKNGNSIFLPAAGYQYVSEFDMFLQSNGYYWSDGLSSSSHGPRYASMMYFHPDDHPQWPVNLDRCVGLSVRPVCSPQ